jgi:predicted HTH transcriptional regulator
MEAMDGHREFNVNLGEEVIETLACPDWSVLSFANANGGKGLIGVNEVGKPVKNFAIGNESVQQWINLVSCERLSLQL